MSKNKKCNPDINAHNFKDKYCATIQDENIPLKKCYRKASLSCHPDKAASNKQQTFDELNKIFKKLSVDYDTCKNYSNFNEQTFAKECTDQIMQVISNNSHMNSDDTFDETYNAAKKANDAYKNATTQEEKDRIKRAWRYYFSSKVPIIIVSIIE